MNSYLKRIVKEFLLTSWVVTKTKSKQSIALTFDDGPSQTFTPELLRVLNKHQVKATFFLVGDHAKAHPDLVHEMIKGGHEIANHSMTHTEFSQASFKLICKELDETSALLSLFNRREKLNNKRILIRTPKGVLNLRVLLYCLMRRKKVILWSKDPEDFAAKSVESIHDFFKKNKPEAGDILLLHEKNQFTSLALDSLIPEWKSSGVIFDTLTPRACV